MAIATLAAIPRIRVARGRRSGIAGKGALGLALFLGAWQISVPLVGLDPYFYPSPLDVADAFVDLVRKGVLPVYVADSLGRYLAGTTIGAGAGLALGVLIGLSRTAARLLGPLISFLFAIVEVAWMPIFVIWFGYGIKTIVLALAYVVFFPVLYNTLQAVRTTPRVHVDAVRSLGGGRLAVLREVILPAALPGITTGLRVGAGFAFRGLVFAEIIAGRSGIGYLIFEGAASHETAKTIVGMIVLGLMWLLLDRCYLRPFERVTIERWGQVTAAGQCA